MLRTFNCGIGMIVVAEAGKVLDIARSLASSSEKLVTLGHIRPRRGSEEQVAISGSLANVS
jgi:phosphoribosylformylglycinamidine cyclo-ligase